MSRAHERPLSDIVNLSDFDYELPPERIAQRPVEPRDAARLLVHDLGKDETSHAVVRELPAFLGRGDLLVVNDTRVRPARLFGRRKTGGSIELLVLGPGDSTRSRRAMVRPAKRLREGETLEIEGGALRARAIRRERDERGLLGTEWIVEITDPREPDRTIESCLESFGRMPVPPYILGRSRNTHPPLGEDRAWYQTIFARESGAVAAPTAGLHFTESLLVALGRRDVEIARITLHVGAGTFQPLSTHTVENHRMHAEEFVVGEAVSDAIARARSRGGRVVAVGTTSARALESSCGTDGVVHATAGSTRLFVTPGYRFRVIDALLTNFHLPKSTLLLLVSAFAGRERILELYSEAIARGYRFYSYGDAMLLLGTRRS